VKSDLGREFKTNFLFSLGIDLIMTVISKTTEAGARSLVLPALTTPEENGKYITHYQSDEDYHKWVLFFSYVAFGKWIFHPSLENSADCGCNTTGRLRRMSLVLMDKKCRQKCGRRLLQS
jgi:hypothetical protein